jgi:hypothetical protein
MRAAGLARNMPPGEAFVKETKKMKKIAIAAAVALGIGAMGLAGSVGAQAQGVRVVVSPYGYYGYGPGPWRLYTVNPWKHLNPVKYIACRTKVAPQRAFSPSFVFMVDNCYLGLPY